MFAYLKQSVKERTVLVLTKPPKVIYNGLKTKIGQPKDYSENNKVKGFWSKDCPTEMTQIPKEIIRRYDLEDESRVEDPDVSMSQNTDVGEKEGDNSNERHGAPGDDSMYTPIKALSTFNYDWRLKARLVKKGERRSWKNARSEGYLMGVELMDSYGTMIQATFFKDACDKFEPILKEGCIYLLSNGNVKIANQRFSSIKNDFCLVFDRNAEITEVPNDESIKEKGYCFTNLDEL